jgi:dihydroorotate dehydrogenase
VVKTVNDNETRRISIRPRFTILHKSGYPEVFSNYSTEFASPYAIEMMVAEITKAKKSSEKLGSVLIGSIMATSITSWKEMARKMEDAGVDMLEIWLGGRTEGTEASLHSLTYAEYCEKVCSAVIDVIKIPVFAKLTLDGVDVLEVSRKIRNTGVSGLTLADRMSGLDIDLKTGRPILAGGYAKVGGPWMRPVMLNWIAKVAKEVSLPVSASGGFFECRDALKAIMCGASTVQLCTVLLYGKR